MSAHHHLLLHKSDDADTVTVNIAVVYDNSGFNPTAEAGKLLDALLSLPVETRRAFYTLLTQEMFDGFTAAPSPKPKVHPWPPKPRIPQ